MQIYNGKKKISPWTLEYYFYAKYKNVNKADSPIE